MTFGKIVCIGSGSGAGLVNEVWKTKIDYYFELIKGMFCLISTSCEENEPNILLAYQP